MGQGTSDNGDVTSGSDGRPKPRRRAVRRWRRLLFSLAAVVLFFVLVEAVLWIAGVPTLIAQRDPFQGFAGKVRVYEHDAQNGVYRPAARALTRSFNDQRFAIDKPDNGFRFFVLGGSSAYGFPWDANTAFTRMLGDALQASYPDRHVEAVNAAAMSYGSHRLRILAAELLDYEPDALVIYGGHNEFIERRFYQDVLERPRQFDGIRYALAHSRLYALLTRAYEGARAAGADEGGQPPRDVAELLGFDVQREIRRDVDDAERVEVRRLFQENLEAIVDLASSRGVPVVLCTVPANLRGWRPEASALDPTLDPAKHQAVAAQLANAVAALDRGDAQVAATALEAARQIAPDHAEVQYHLGRACEALGRMDEAQLAYRHARDADARPIRATSGLNDAVRDVADRSGSVLVDIERLFEQEAPDGLVGFNLFEDYVHPKPQAHRRIARALWERLLAEGWLGAPRPAEVAAFDAAVGQTGLGTANTDGPDAARDAKTPRQLFNLAYVLENQGLGDQAMDKYRACLKLDPDYTQARSNLAYLLNQAGHPMDAAAEYRRALDGEPGHLPSQFGLGEALYHLGSFDESARQLQAVTRADPGSLQAWKALGLALRRLGKHAEAETAARRAVELDPEDAEARAGLGWALLSQGKHEQARAEFEAARASAPHHHRARNGLATALTQAGQLGEAERLFSESLRLDPEDGFAQRGLDLIRRLRQGG